ncbi:MAG: phosphoribosylanthranilate isomerase [Planctomycetaceae bacterium]|jgi:phosphoribosylanthranilate isomerase|nr:phosphoribosylanthranilate isomerase [Planctomycetaceae bacterium]
MFIKICGITTPEDAAAVFKAGADCIGIVHYPKSPRHLTAAQMLPVLDAAEPFRKQGRKTVLVAADAAATEITDILEKTGNRFDHVQVHRELTDDEFSLLSNGLLRHNTGLNIIRVIRTLETVQRLRQCSSPSSLTARLYLLELSHGQLPGGNGKSWDWSAAKPFCQKFPTLLAGGITPENVADLLRQAEPFGIDLSSGVELSPGRKDIEKVRKMITIVRSFS